MVDAPSARALKEKADGRNIPPLANGSSVAASLAAPCSAYAAYLGALMALPPAARSALAQGLASTRRQSVIWLSFQECTGCTESLTRSFSPTLENLIFDFISLDYHETLQAASGEAAEDARRAAMAANKGKYVVVVDGSVSTKDGGVYSTIAGVANVDMLRDAAKDALAVVAVGSCAAFGGLPAAEPNPTGAVAVSRLVDGQARRHHPRLPADRRGGGGNARLPRRLRQVARARFVSAVPRRSSAKRFTIAATAAPFTSAACSPKGSTTRAPGGAIASTKSAARGR